MKKLFSLSPKAISKLKEVIENRNPPPKGIRVCIQTKGCSGLAYKIEYADFLDESDECVEEEGIKIMIAKDAVLFVIGTVMDFVDNKFDSGFVFNNPNQKGTCGCGESFYV